MNKKQVERMNDINKLIELIGDTDREFFNSKNGRSKFIELKTTVKFVDGYTQQSMSITDDRRPRYFSNGGTLLALVRDFKYYILHGSKSDGKYGYGGLYSTSWGYSIEGVHKIIEFAKEIGYVGKEMPSYKEYLVDLYRNNSYFMSSWMKENIEKELLNKDNELQRTMAIKNIEGYIKKKGYTYKVEDVLESYKKYWLNGYYTSYTMTDCIKHLEEDIKVVLWR